MFLSIGPVSVRGIGRDWGLGFFRFGFQSWNLEWNQTKPGPRVCFSLEITKIPWEKKTPRSRFDESEETRNLVSSGSVFGLGTWTKLNPNRDQGAWFFEELPKFFEKNELLGLGLMNQKRLRSQFLPVQFLVSELRPNWTRTKSEEFFFSRNKFGSSYTQTLSFDLALTEIMDDFKMIDSCFQQHNSKFKT